MVLHSLQKNYEKWNRWKTLTGILIKKNWFHTLYLKQINIFVEMLTVKVTVDCISDSRQGKVEVFTNL